MEYKELKRPKSLAECRIDWKHYPVKGENGKVTLEDCTHLRSDWLEEDCKCDANNLADTEKCDRYFAFDYDYEKLRLYYEIPSFQGTPFDIWGLQKMFNDKWLLTPAFVKWIGKNSFGYIVYELWLEDFLNGIYDLCMRVEILQFIIKNADYIIPDTMNEELPRLHNTLDRYEAAYLLDKKMNGADKIVIERNTYNNCTFNNTTNIGTQNNYAQPPSSASSAESSESSTSKRGRKVKPLFADDKGVEDIQRKEEERNRFLNYLKDHDLSQRLLDTSKENLIHKAIVCFCKKWKQLRYIKGDISASAVFRVLTVTCGLHCNTVEERGISNVLAQMLKSDCDESIYYDVKEYF